MWRSLWRSIDRFSLQHFKHVINELREIKVVDKHNRELVVDLLQSIVEIVTYGDRQDPMIFECFMEYQVLTEFVRLLKISRNSRIEAPLLQYLSIMIQNMNSEHAIYYCLSNDYINSIIAHQYNFDVGDLAPYYISFLRAVSSKINRDMLCLLVKVRGDVLVSFPLYSEALKFAQHGEKMIQTAVRALSLNIYNVSDDMVYQFVSTPPASKYFSDLVHKLKEQCVHLDSIVLATEGACINQRRKDLLLQTDKIVDDLYYFKDILCIGASCLSEVVTQNLLNLLVFPILLPLLQLRQNDGSDLSAITSLYILCRLLQIVGGKKIINCVAEIILYPFMLSMRDASELSTDNSFSNHWNDVEKLVGSGSEFEGAENINGDLLCKLMSSSSHSVNYIVDDNVCQKRSGILAFIFSDNHTLLLASLFLLLTLAESKDIEHLLASMIGPSTIQHRMDHNISDLEPEDRNIFVKFMPQILNALLKVLASEPSISKQIPWHTGWFLQKLLVLQGKRLDDHTSQLFNTSYEQSRERLRKELDGCWFDYVLDTLRNEWASCKTALEKPSQTIDPLFLLELTACLQKTDGNVSTYASWQRMVDTVKVFIVHFQLKALICKEEVLEKSLLAPLSTPSGDSGRIHASDPASTSFGSEISLGSGIPCRIAFSNAGIRDIYMIPVARGTSGKLFLVEKHPFRSQRGVVIAIAPLAGLSPKIDEDHTTWLHLRIREFDPKLYASRTRSDSPKGFNHAADGRWTLGFSNAKTCEAARLAILGETNKQRSSVKSSLALLLGDKSHGQDQEGSNVRGL
ncbi:protein TRANSPARENT TESTA 9 isoform X1 [Ricinus communis]|uniref:protein TRANSPARENT TESTA 9 isoform X1 n=1 Tax=Ricinus communis TaxID=3988 RepID=UPI00201AE4B7|nr:protein TRANSPARENT TESTA 9 isoform X1 [Ricinus communis]